MRHQYWATRGPSTSIPPTQPPRRPWPCPVRRRTGFVWTPRSQVHQGPLFTRGSSGYEKARFRLIWGVRNTPPLNLANQGRRGVRYGLHVGSYELRSREPVSILLLRTFPQMHVLLRSQESGERGMGAWMAALHVSLTHQNLWSPDAVAILVSRYAGPGRASGWAAAACVEIRRRPSRRGCATCVCQQLDLAASPSETHSPARQSARPPLSSTGSVLVDTQRGILQSPPSNESARYPTCFLPLSCPGGGGSSLTRRATTPGCFSWLCRIPREFPWEP